MRFATLLSAAALVFAPQPAAAEESFQAALQRPGGTPAALYSFSDLYRLAVAGPAPDFAPVPPSGAAVRTVASAPPAQFSFSEASEPRLGALLLAGIALALWVARRRVGYAF